MNTTKADPSVVQPNLLRLITARLAHASYESYRDRLNKVAEEISEDVKRLLFEHVPVGFKLISTVQIVENKGQAGRSALSTYWDDASDGVFREVWSNDTLLVTVIAFAVRVAY